MSLSTGLALADLRRGETRPAAPAFVGILWTGACLSFCFLIFRLFIRIKVFRKLFADDYLVIGAWIIILTSAIIWQTQYKIVYQLYGFYAVGAFPDASFLTRFEVFLKIQNAVFVLFYTCLLAVKLSFLIFFRRLGLKVKGFKVWWWFVLGISIASWLTCIGDVQWQCDHGPVGELFIKCSQPAAINFQWTTLHYNTAIDIITDAMIISIPVLLLWNTKIQNSQKLALLGVFSLTIITITFSIIRVAVVTVPNAQANIIWLGFWGNIEMSISVIVACLGSFRQLFVKQNATVPKQRQVGLVPTDSDKISPWHRGLLSRSRKFYSSSSPGTLGTTKEKNKLPGGTDLQNTSSERIVSIQLQSIQITDDYDVEFASVSSRNVLNKPSAALTNPSRTMYKSNGKGNGPYQEIHETV